MDPTGPMLQDPQRRPAAPAWLTNAMRRLEDAAGLDGPGDVLARLSAPLAGPIASRVLRGEWLGHAVHPLLTDFPLGFWMSAGCLDIGGGRRSRPAATGLVALGVVTALPTAASGVAEWRATTGPARRVGVAHALLNTGGLILYGASLAARLRGRHRAGVALGLSGGIAATVGGYLGGHLSLVRKIGTADPAFTEGRAPGAPPGG